MSSLAIRDTIADRLTGDTTLSDLLTGGIYRADEVLEISKQRTPAAYDATSTDLLPCALLTFPQQTPTGSALRRSAWLYLDIYLYAQDSHEALHTAVERIFDLLHEWAVGVGGWEVRHTNDTLDQEEPGMHVAMAITRYRIGVSR